MSAHARISRRRLKIAAASVVAMSVYAVLQLRVILLSEPGPLQSLRTAFWHDQLGYLSIVANVSSGDVDTHEPVTITGVNHYPRVYYTGVGLIARILHLQPVVAWNLTSVLLQLTAVGTLAIAMSVIARRWWVGMLAPAAFFTGTLATVRNGSWVTPLDSHAVLWGPYGAMFSNNAETAGLSVITIVLSALAMAWWMPRTKAARVAVGVIAAILLGMLSGFQTYSFLSGVYVVASIVAVFYLIGARWWWTAASLAGLFALVGLGPLVADRVGQLPTLVFGLLPLLPGLIRAIAQTRGMVAVYGAVAALAAAPQIVWTMSGVISGDPFLSYRVASNVNLGVTGGAAVVSTLVIALPWSLAMYLATSRRDSRSLAALAGTAAVSLLLALNDRWGANAEPYRFWIELFFLNGVVIALVFVRLLGEAEGATRQARGWRTAAIRAWAALCVVVYAVSLLDFWTYSRDASMNVTWDPTSPRESAIAEAAGSAPATGAGGLLLTDVCIDPRTTKVTSGAAIAYYYLGMAWPLRVDEVATVMADRDADTLTASELAAADVRWLLTDSACATPLEIDGADLTRDAAFAYGDEQITVWRVR